MNKMQLKDLIVGMASEIMKDDFDIYTNGGMIELSQASLSSLQLVSLIVCIEERLDIEIPDEALADFGCIDDIIGYLLTFLKIDD